MIAGWGWGWGWGLVGAKCILFLSAFIDIEKNVTSEMLEAEN